MKKLSTEEFENKLAALPEVEPDEIDLKMLSEIDAHEQTPPFPLLAIGGVFIVLLVVHFLTL